MTTTEPITYLYRCWDRDGQLLYVGVTDNVERRKREHAKDKFWWHDVTRVTRMAFQRRIEALWAEWAVISTCTPIYNCSAAIPPLPGGPVVLPVQPVVQSSPVAPRRRSTSKSRRRAPRRPIEEWVSLAKERLPAWELETPTGPVIGSALDLSSDGTTSKIRQRLEADRLALVAARTEEGSS